MSHMRLGLPSLDFSSTNEGRRALRAGKGSASGPARQTPLDERLQAVRLVDGDEGVLDGDPSLLAELTQRARDGFPGGARHGSNFFMSQEQREMVSPAFEVFADLMRQLQQEAAEPAGNGLGEGDAAGVLESEAVFLADALDCSHLGFLMSAEEAEEPFPLDRAQLGVSKRLGRNLVDTVREDGIQAEHGSGTR